MFCLFCAYVHMYLWGTSVYVGLMKTCTCMYIDELLVSFIYTCTCS